MRLKIEIQPVALRPLFVLEQAEHRLAIEQCPDSAVAKARKHIRILMRKSLSEF